MNLDAELAMLSEAVYLPTWPEVEAAIAPHWQLAAPLDIGDTEGMLCRRGAECSALVFRGTEFSRGKLGDIAANFGTWTNWEGPGSIHAGYYRHVDTIFEAARHAAKQAAGAPLYMTGHSLGGISATVYTARIGLHSDGHAIDALVTFGAPKAFNPQASKVITVPSRRYVVSGDFAPRWPLNPWLRHHCPPITLEPPVPHMSPLKRHWTETYRKTPALMLEV